LTAEPNARDERTRILAEITARGFSDGYTGIRISRTGKRFLIDKATVWTFLTRRETPSAKQRHSPHGGCLGTRAS
jgi:MEKHLA domain-containing protein